ncbi:MAG: hypothetical protein Q8R63_04015 [Ramlibacter sp.]|nr:hypothetical protein [Ramlibacter sp.]
MKNLTNLLAATLILLTGCATSTSPHYDMRFGEAVRAARLAMTINPDAGRSTDPVAGMDGRAAHETLLRYQESFRSPPPPVNVINIGGAVGAK